MSPHYSDPTTFTTELRAFTLHFALLCFTTAFLSDFLLYLGSSELPLVAPFVLSLSHILDCIMQNCYCLALSNGPCNVQPLASKLLRRSMNSFSSAFLRLHSSVALAYTVYLPPAQKFPSNFPILPHNMSLALLYPIPLRRCTNCSALTKQPLQVPIDLSRNSQHQTGHLASLASAPPAP